MIHDRFPMLEALHAEGPAPTGRATRCCIDSLSTRGTGALFITLPRVSPVKPPAKCISGGRWRGAVQDVWIMPSRSARQAPGVSAPGMPVWHHSARLRSAKRSPAHHLDRPAEAKLRSDDGRKVGDNIAQEYRT